MAELASGTKENTIGVAWVTGAARGIGSATAAELATRGFFVWVSDIDEKSLTSVTKEILEAGGSCAAVVCDVANTEDVENAAIRILEQSGRLDVVVNNAGVFHVDELLDLTFETWRRVMSVNADGTFLVGQASARRMVQQPHNDTLKRRGLIVNVASSAAEVGRPPRAAYGASKALVKHLTMTQAMALAPHDVAATVIYPGEVMEGMLAGIYRDESLAEGVTVADVVERKAQALPAGRFQPAQEVAARIAFLACSRGMAFNGHLLWADTHLQRM